VRLMRDGRYGTHREKQTLTGVFEHHLTTSPVTKVRVVVVLRWGTTQEGPVLRFFNGNLFSLDISAYVVY
jgi:hypothetical protein